MRAALGGLGLIVGALLACGRGERESLPVASASALIATPLPSVSAAAVAVASDKLLTSSASFADERLVACSDLALPRAPLAQLVEAAARKDAGTVALDVQDAAAEELKGYLLGWDTLVERTLDAAAGKGTGRALRPVGKPTAITKPCHEQFRGRVVVAACALTARVGRDGGLSFDVALVISHFDATAGDAPMRACLAAKGDWHELGQDSPELGALRRRQTYEKLQKEYDP